MYKKIIIYIYDLYLEEKEREREKPKKYYYLLYTTYFDENNKYCYEKQMF